MDSTRISYLAGLSSTHRLEFFCCHHRSHFCRSCKTSVAALVLGHIPSAQARAPPALSHATASFSEDGFRASERELIPANSISGELEETLPPRLEGRLLSKNFLPVPSALVLTFAPASTRRLESCVVSRVEKSVISGYLSVKQCEYMIIVSRGEKLGNSIASS